MNQLELKDYQTEVLSDLDDFVKIVVENGNIASSYRKYWLHRGIVLGQNNLALKPYNDTVPGVPRITSKVPTAGGKTFIGCNAISTIFKALPERGAKVVVWFVPSDTILEQTLEKLRDVTHPYRQRLDALFNGRVVVVDKEAALMGTNISPTEVREQLTILVLSAASFIDADRPERARVFRDNGYLEGYAKLFDSTTRRVPHSGETGLIQVLSYLNPLVIVDESHNFTADLRNDMLNNVNPCFIYELTATPRDGSNIISFIGADKLKRANMVKLPVIVHNDQNRDAVISNAITLRENLEREAKANEAQGGEYIRPIVLFQAQSNISEDSETFDKIKNRLVSQFGIKADEIAIKTASVNEIKGIDLMSKDCKIRYIITVNALKEGWDCPFAYILASLANRTSKVDVEQILGRILRQPYAKKHKATFLNMSYVFTCSLDFDATLQSIIASLNKSGFSHKDYRSVSPNPTHNTAAPIVIDPERPTQVDDLFETPTSATSEPLIPNINNDFTSSDDKNSENSSDFTAPLSTSLSDLQSSSRSEVQQMLSDAQNVSKAYEAEIDADTHAPSSLPSDVLADANVYPMTDSFRTKALELRIPQFFFYSAPSLIAESSTQFLEKINLLEGINLDSEDSNITFDFSESATRMIDLDKDKDFTPTEGKLKEQAMEIFRQYYMPLSTEGKIRELVGKIMQTLNIKGVSDGQVRNYVQKVVSRLNNEQLTSLAANLGSTIKAFKNKIDIITSEYRERKFFSLLTVDELFVEPSYQFSDTLILPETSPQLYRSLYQAEDKMNGFEYRVIKKVADHDNVLFWHRNIEYKGFRINGYINHYPDFIIVTKNGKIIMLETKGDDRKNPDSMAKLNLGKAWANRAGNNYRYFMVFDNNPMEGALSVNKFLETLSHL
ncbi:MAG: DEAD/DEAH box helicase family protein [Muribaculaceae bacterium]|nr:DEAD/DEAH box helicase family protein [Muribaculaceae bacterium]